MTHDEYLKIVAEVNRLRNEIHLFSTEEISEQALDDLKHKISIYESQNPEKISPNSPNYNVAGGVAKGFSKFKHQRRMLSLNDIFDFKELEDWQQRWENYIEKNFYQESQIHPVMEDGIMYVCEPKLDGLAISLHYSNGKLIAAATRGDGFTGELVTENVYQVKNIPKQIEDKRDIEIRGEIFLTKRDFENLNQRIIKGEIPGKMGKYGKDFIFANPRNASSGTIRQLDSRIVHERNLSFVAYGIYIKS